MGRIGRFAVTPWAIAIVILSMLTGCERYGGGSLGSSAIPQSTLQYCHILQYDLASRGSPTGKAPLFAIIWKSPICGGATTNGRNLFTEIHGRRIEPSLTQKAVYALQPDYSLKRISLADDEVDHVFGLIESQAGAATMEADSLWQTKIMPNLRVLAAPATGQASTQ